MKKSNITRILAAAAACATLAASLSGCASKGGDSENKGSKEKNESSTESVINGNKVEVFLAEDGTPYYINEDGEKMMLFATPFADDAESGDTDSNAADSESFTEQQYIKGQFSENGLEFKIPDGWMVDNTFGAPTMFSENETAGQLNYDEAISIVPTSYVFDTIKNGEADEDAIKDYFKELVDADFYTDFEFLGSGESEVCGTKAKYFDIKASMQMDTEDSAGTFRMRYIITPGENSHCIILSSLDTDESAKLMQEVLDSFIDTIKLPTAEQMQAATDELDADNAGEDIESAE